MRRSSPSSLSSQSKSPMLSAKLTSMLRRSNLKSEDVADQAAENLALKILAVKEKKRKAVDATGAKKNKRNKN